MKLDSKQKKTVDESIQAVSKILIMTMAECNIPNFIEAVVVYKGERYKLNFTKEVLNE